MHRRNQSGNLINADTILRDITPDDLCDQAEINHLRGVFIGHNLLPRRFDWGLSSRERFNPQFPKRKIFQLLAAHPG
jgi:hypothetical protein